MKKEIVGTLLVLALMSICVKVIPSNATIQAIEKTLSEQVSTQIQYFRMLALEGTATSGRAQSAQYLIEALLNYTNWNNSTEKYISYIHLLSDYAKDEVIDMTKPFWTGYSTKANLRNEIINFLDQASANETVVLYCATNGLELQLYLGTAPNYEVVDYTELLSWLSAVKATVCIILDVCHSGSWIDDGLGGVLGPGRIVLAGCKSAELCAVTSPPEAPYIFGVFTGIKIMRWNNGSILGLGIIGGLTSGTDSNKDGWISFGEDFQFAKTSVQQYMNNLQNPVSYNGLGFDPLFVLRTPPQPPVANFSYSPTIPWANESVVFNASTSNGTIINYSWNFGDGNITTVSEPAISHIYSAARNYTVTLNITDTNGLWNATTKKITVTFMTDINKDRTVDILDIAIVAKAYGTRPGDKNWNSIADLDKSGEIDIIDIAMVAKDYGKSI
jgi:hypothetical protein